VYTCVRVRESARVYVPESQGQTPKTEVRVRVRVRVHEQVKVKKGSIDRSIVRHGDGVSVVETDNTGRDGQIIGNPTTTSTKTTTLPPNNHWFLVQLVLVGLVGSRPRFGVCHSGLLFAPSPHPPHHGY